MNPITVTVTKMGYEGHGVAYDKNNFVYFIPRTVPGDVVLIHEFESLKKYREVSRFEMIEASRERVTPQCAYFQDCGGCDWLHWNYEAQVKTKEALVRHNLNRIQLNPEVFHPIIKADQLFYYRNRVQFRSENGKIGFFRRKSHDIVDMEECVVSRGEINEKLKSLRNTLDEREKTLTKIEVVVDESHQVKTFFNSSHGSGGFTQIHDDQNKKLQTLVSNLVKKYEIKNLIELFSGNGNLTFSFAEYLNHFLGIDANQPAIEDAQKKAREKSLSHLQFKKYAIQHGTLYREGKNFEALLLDPPRQGSFGVLSIIPKNIRTIIYVSCSPLSFSHEANSFLKSYQLKEVYPIDMFPHTRHIELVAVFVLK